LSIAIATPAAQAQAQSSDAPKPSKLKLTTQHLKEVLAKWRQNKPKLKNLPQRG
jgi:hypothetical protein